jgi:prepilin-type processing-associated H-X9-DG protein
VEIRHGGGQVVSRLSYFHRTLLTGHYEPHHPVDLKELYVGRGDSLTLLVFFEKRTGTDAANALAQEDLARLKGEWVLTEKPPPFQAGDGLEIRFGDGDFELRRIGNDVERQRGTFAIEAAKRELVLNLKDGAEKVPVRCGYRVDGDRLRLDLAGLVGDQSGGGLRLAERIRSQNNLNQIALAMHAYHDAKKQLPPAAITAGGKPLLSWRVALLPYLEQVELYKEFRLDEPWDSPHNLPLAVRRMPAVYATPVTRASGAGMTHYRVFAGPGTAFEPRPDGKGVGIGEIQDGTSNTLLVVEAADPVVWTRPDDLPFDAQRPVAKVGVYDAGINFAFCDGSVTTLAPGPSDQALRELITRSGGEFISAAFLRQAPPQGPPLYLEFRRR